MKCVCKYCNEDYDVSDWKSLTVDAHRQDDNDILDDVDGDTNISPYSMEVVLTPSRNLMGEYCGDATFLAKDRAMLFMRYMRKHIAALKENGE